MFAKIDNTDPIKGEKFELEPSEDFDFDQSLKVLSETRQQEITTKFKRESDAFYLEAKRSVVATQAKVPYWVGVALVVLGWNEFLAVITNPLYLMVLAMVGVPMVAMWYLDMLGFVEMVAWKVYDQGSALAKDSLRGYLNKGGDDRGQNQQRQPQQYPSQQNRSSDGKEESGIELSSLGSKKSQ